ncbi:MAG: hypothetical protein IJH31_03880 [Erysipelotrichaceae bacterium]|nr:hypothetical protein [Erysipelotrichaceae bacterium]
MINLKNYIGQNVIIKTKNNLIFKGFVSDYFPSDENENGEESIALENPAIEFNKDEIKEISII